jgi:hypothetical protein
MSQHGRYATTTAPRAELSTPAGVRPAETSRPKVPFRGGDHNAAGQTGLSTVVRLSIKSHEVDPLRVYEQLFGQEAHVDEHTGGVRTHAGRAAAGPLQR